MLINPEQVRTESQAGYLEQIDLPQPCIHEDFLEDNRRSMYSFGSKARHPVCCPNCGQKLKDDSELKAQDAPALAHAAIFYSVFFLIYTFSPLGKIHSDIAMWIAWLVTFAFNYKTQTPLSAARNAILIIFAIDTVMIYAHFWRGLSLLTYDQIILHAVNSFMASMIAVTPMFVSRGIHLLIDRLKNKGGQASFD